MICINKKVILLVIFLLFFLIFTISIYNKKNSNKSQAAAPLACSVDQRCNQDSYYFRCKKNVRKIAITFDDCFFPQIIPDDLNYKRHITISDIVKKANDLKIPLSFFCVGRSLETDKDFFSNLIKKNDGRFELQNHTYNHQDLNSLSLTQIRYQIEAWNNAYNQLSLTKNKDSPIYLRPPGMSGVDNKDVIRIARELGIRGLAGSSIASKASLDGNLKSQDITTCIKKNLASKGGDIIILHPLKTDLEVLENIVNLIGGNFEFVTLSELMKE